MTSERRLFPWATMISRSPFFTQGRIADFQYGRTRSSVFFRLSPLGRDVKTAAPYLDLRIPEFLRRLRLVEPLQVAVMPLVQRLVIVDGDRLLPGDVRGRC